MNVHINHKEDRNEVDGHTDGSCVVNTPLSFSVYRVLGASDIVHARLFH